MGDRPNTKGEREGEEMKRTSAVVIALATVQSARIASGGVSPAPWKKRERCCAELIGGTRHPWKQG